MLNHLLTYFEVIRLRPGHYLIEKSSRNNSNPDIPTSTTTNLSNLLRTGRGQGVSPSSPREWGPCGRLSVELPCPVLSPGPAPGLCSRGAESKDLGTDASPLAQAPFPAGVCSQLFRLTLLIPKRGVTVFLGGGCRHGARWALWRQEAPRPLLLALPWVAPSGQRPQHNTGWPFLLVGRG